MTENLALTTTVGEDAVGDGSVFLVMAVQVDGVWQKRDFDRGCCGDEGELRLALRRKMAQGAIRQARP